MSEAIVGAIIAAVAAAGTTVYSVQKSSSEAAKNRKAQADILAKQEADAKAANAPKPATAENFPDVAAQMRARLAAEKSGAGAGGLSSSFFTQDLEEQFPGFDQLAQSIVSGSYQPKTPSAGG